MGIAWFDDEAPPISEPVLRIGGIPILTPDQTWPICMRCGVPMLFRAQIPLALTSLVSPYDNRLLHFFECHAHLDNSICDFGTLLISEGTGTPREAPVCQMFGVLLLDYGPNTIPVARVVNTLLDPMDSVDFNRVNQSHDYKDASELCFNLPAMIMSNVPPSIGIQAIATLSDMGASIKLVPMAPTTLPDVRGGKLIPFDDGNPSSHKTTLPKITKIQADFGQQAMRGFIGGSTPGYRDHGFKCTCGRPTRTAVRLLADESIEVIHLGPTVAHLCIHCSSGSLYRKI